MLKLGMFSGGAIVGVVSQAPSINIDLNGILIALMAVVGALAAGGIISTRRTRAKLDAETRNLEANTNVADGQAVLTHAQYEGFISEAAERINQMQEASMARLEKELAIAQKRIAELQAELEKAKGERNMALAEAALRERDLKTEIDRLQDRVADLERRLEASGFRDRRRRTSGEQREAGDDDDNDNGLP